MKYTDTTGAYNDRRYGKPWMAIVVDSLTRGFDFIDWQGTAGSCGRFNFSAEPGTMVAYGQKDIRKGKGGVDGYQVCMPDGSMPIVPIPAADLIGMDMEDRWRAVAKAFLAAATKQMRPDQYGYQNWVSTRNERSARYSAMLGIADPIMAETAEAFGLTQPAPQQPAVDMSAFGL